MSFTPPKCKAYCETAFKVLMGVSACGAVWLVIFSACQWASLPATPRYDHLEQSDAR